MGWIDAAGTKPADYAFVHGDRFNNFLYPDDPHVARLDVAGSTSWELVGPYPSATVAASGAVTGQTITLPTHGAVPSEGTYTLYCYGPDRGTAWKTYYGKARFYYTSDRAGVARNPVRSSETTAGNYGQPQSDGWLTSATGGMFRRVPLLLRHSAGDNPGGAGQATVATSVTATMNNGQFGEYIGGESRVFAIHRFVGPAGATFTTTANDNPWTLAGTHLNGDLRVNVYARAFGGGRASLTVNSSAAGDHTLTIVEFPLVDPQTALALGPFFTDGSGTTATVTVDTTASDDQEHFPLAAVVRRDSTAGPTSVSGTLLPWWGGVITEGGTGKIAYAFLSARDGLVRSLTTSWSGSTTWVGVGFAVKVPDTYAADLARAVNCVQWLRQHRPDVDPARPFPLVFQLGWSQGYEKKIASVVTDLAEALDVDPSQIWVSGRNEPYNGPPLNVPGEVVPFAAAVHAAGGTAVGPGMVNVHEAGFGLTLSRHVSQDGIDELYDEIDVHTYNEYTDPLNAVDECRWFRQEMTSVGVDTRDILDTETGTESTFLGSGRAYAHGALIAFSAVLRELIWDMPWTAVQWYYDRRGGYDGLPLFAATDAGPFPAFPLLDRFGRAVHGKRRSQEWKLQLDPYHLGGVWGAPEEERVAVLVGVSTGLPPVKLGVSGARSVVVRDHWLEPTTVQVQPGGWIEVEVSPLPTYVDVPAGVDVQPWYGPAPANKLLTAGQVVGGTDVAQPAPFTGPIASWRVQKLFDGDPRTSYLLDDGSTGEAAVDGQTGQGESRDGVCLIYLNQSGSSTITFGLIGSAKVTGTHLVLSCCWPWQGNSSTLMDFDVQTQSVAGGPWTTRDTFTQTSLVRPFLSFEDDTFEDDHTPLQMTFVADLGGRQDVHGIRLVIRDASSGMWHGATRQRLRQSGASYRPLFTARELAVYDLSEANAVPGLAG